MVITQVTWNVLMSNEVDESPIRTEFADVDKEKAEICVIPLRQSPYKTHISGCLKKTSTDFDIFFGKY